MNAIPEVNFEEISGREGNIGLITLNRPKALNALSHQMILAMDNQIKEWESTNHIKCIIIRAAEGRAFCAGGDVRSIYELKLANDPAQSNFFRDEYQLNRRIFHCSKPYIAFLDGITMGGGAGVSLHGSHRIATERLVFAMPETSIGFYPDVGMTYFLSRLPYKTGIYLGLTGARISYNDCFALGIADQVVKHNIFPELTFALADTAFGKHPRSVVTEVIEKFSIPAPASTLLEHRVEIEKCFSKNSVEEILQALENYSNAWCKEVATIIKTKSPTSLKVTLEALHEASKLDFDECMQMEFRLTERFLKGKDFFEGIRAVLIDKDQKPRWQPASLEEVSMLEVTKYFSPLEKELV